MGLLHSGVDSIIVDTVANELEYEFALLSLALSRPRLFMRTHIRERAMRIARARVGVRASNSVRVHT